MPPLVMQQSLRDQLTQLVQLGLVEQTDAEALVELFGEAYQQCSHRGEVAKAERVVQRLANLVQLVQEHGPAVVIANEPEPGPLLPLGQMRHRRIGILCHSGIMAAVVGAQLGERHVHGHAGHGGPPAVDVLRNGEVLGKGEVLHLTANDLTFRREFFSLELDRPAAEFYSSAFPEPLAFRSHISIDYFEKEYLPARKEPPRPKFEGYYGKGKRRGKKW